MNTDISIPNNSPIQRSPLRRLLRLGRHGLHWVVGYLAYLFTKRTTPSGYTGMRVVFTMTNGKFTSALARFMGLFWRPKPMPEARGILGNLTPDSVGKIVEKITEEGLYISPIRLSPEACEALRDHCRKAQCHLVPAPKDGPPDQPYDPAHPVAPRYDVTEAHLLELPEAVKLLIDQSFYAVTQAYLKAAPVNDMIWAWWTVPFNQGQASSAAAQYYHFDLDRHAFLKMFIYLTDVTTDNGPHWFVKRSHKNKPKGLLVDDRISDAAIREHFPNEDIVEITGLAGTVFVEDTRGYHKGSPVVTGERLAMEVQLSDSLFGAPYTKHDVQQGNPELQAAARADRHAYARFSV